MRNNYRDYTTKELEAEVQFLKGIIPELIIKKNALIKELKDCYADKDRASRLLYSRKRSKYDGQYYTQSSFRREYGMPFRELPVEKKREYDRARYYARKLQKSQQKDKESEKNGNGI